MFLNIICLIFCAPAFMVYRVIQVKGNCASEPCKHCAPGDTEGPFQLSPLSAKLGSTAGQMF